MKIAKFVSRSHPVLSPLGDDVTPNDFGLELTFDCDNDHWFLKANISHQSSTLDSLIDSGAANYALHFECRSTFFRKIYTFTNTEEDIKISAEDLKGKVDVSLFALTTADLPAYTIHGQHEDYGNRQFHVGASEILAVGLPMSFHAFLDYDPIEKVSSILRIEKSEDAEVKVIRLDFNDERKIIAILPCEDYKLYQQLRGVQDLEGLLVSNILFPTILQTLHYLAELKRGSPEEFEQEKASKIWARSIVYKLESSDFDFTGDVSSCLESAQILLKTPLRRGLNSLNELWTQN